MKKRKVNIAAGFSSLLSAYEAAGLGTAEDENVCGTTPLEDVSGDLLQSAAALGAPGIKTQKPKGNKAVAKSAAKAGSPTVLKQSSPKLQTQHPTATHHARRTKTSRDQDGQSVAATDVRSSTAAGPPARPGQPSKAWDFPVDFKDHFETGLAALKHIDPVLRWLAARIGRKPQDLIIYDPYYCQGSVVRHWHALGYPNVINRNRDFYADVDSGSVPEYDVLVTNPPYSLDHKERILKFCCGSGKPWLLLMPNYVANKSYWQQATQHTHTEHDQPLSGSKKRKHSGQRALETDMKPQPGSCGEPFYVVPSEKYEFKHPQGAGHSSSPFFSIWFVHLGSHTRNACTELQRRQQQLWAGGARVEASAQDLRQAGAAPAWKRPNPKQRNKLKKQKQSS